MARRLHAQTLMTIHHSVLGHFDRAAEARRCLRELRRGQKSRPHMTLSFRRRGESHEEIPVTQTDAGGGLLQGLILGGLTGTLGALLVGGVPGDPGFSPVFAIFGGVACAVLGGLAGALVGAGNPHPELEAMEEVSGITVIVTSPDAEDRAWAERIFRAYGTTPAGHGPPAHGAPRPQ